MQARGGVSFDDAFFGANASNITNGTYYDPSYADQVQAEVWVSTHTHTHPRALTSMLVFGVLSLLLLLCAATAFVLLGNSLLLSFFL